MRRLKACLPKKFARHSRRILSRGTLSPVKLPPKVILKGFFAAAGKNLETQRIL
jgi:hypothetical protein